MTRLPIIPVVEEAPPNKSNEKKDNKDEVGMQASGERKSQQRVVRFANDDNSNTNEEGVKSVGVNEEKKDDVAMAHEALDNVLAAPVGHVVAADADAEGAKNEQEGGVAGDIRPVSPPEETQFLEEEEEHTEDATTVSAPLLLLPPSTTAMNMNPTHFEDVYPNPNPNEEEDEDDPDSTKPYRKKLATTTPAKPAGRCGLGNLGNTCFMNSTLQCLAHTDVLRNYFSSGAYAKDLNRDNPLGTGGELAMEFANLMRQMWGTTTTAYHASPDGGGSSFPYTPLNGTTTSTTHQSTSLLHPTTRPTTVYPRTFKYTLGRHAEQFMGYDQHDSQELATYLLDALHEDCNKIRQKPYVEKPEQKPDESDQQASQKAWELHLQREDSLVNSIFVGQSKSKVTCPQTGCGRVSTTFDPFMYLSVPIPGATDRLVSVVYVPLEAHQKVRGVKVVLSKNATVGTLQEKIASSLMQQQEGAIKQQQKVKKEDLCVVDLWNEEVYSFLSPSSEIGKIRENDTTYVYQLTPVSEIQRELEEYKKEEKEEGDGSGVKVACVEQDPCATVVDADVDVARQPRVRIPLPEGSHHDRNNHAINSSPTAVSDNESEATDLSTPTTSTLQRVRKPEDQRGMLAAAAAAAAVARASSSSSSSIQGMAKRTMPYGTTHSSPSTTTTTTTTARNTSTAVAAFDTKHKLDMTTELQLSQKEEWIPALERYTRPTALNVLLNAKRSTHAERLLYASKLEGFVRRCKECVVALEEEEEEGGCGGRAVVDEDFDSKEEEEEEAEEEEESMSVQGVDAENNDDNPAMGKKDDDDDVETTQQMQGNNSGSDNDNDTFLPSSNSLHKHTTTTNPEKTLSFQQSKQSGKYQAEADSELLTLEELSSTSTSFQNVETREDVLTLDYCAGKFRQHVHKMHRDRFEQFKEGIVIQVLLKRDASSSSSAAFSSAALTSARRGGGVGSVRHASTGHSFSSLSSTGTRSGGNSSSSSFHSPQHLSLGSSAPASRRGEKKFFEVPLVMRISPRLTVHGLRTLVSKRLARTFRSSAASFRGDDANVDANANAEGVGVVQPTVVSAHEEEIAPSNATLMAQHGNNSNKTAGSGLIKAESLNGSSGLLDEDAFVDSCGGKGSPANAARKKPVAIAKVEDLNHLETVVGESSAEQVSLQADKEEGYWDEAAPTSTNGIDCTSSEQEESEKMHTNMTSSPENPMEEEEEAADEFLGRNDIFNRAALTYQRKSVGTFSTSQYTNRQLGSLELASLNGMNVAKPTDEKESDFVAEIVGKFGLVSFYFPATIADEFFDPSAWEEEEEEEKPSCEEEALHEEKKKTITVLDCVKKYCHREQLEESDMWYCNRCKTHVRAWKQMHIYRSPPVLILHLKRFQYSSTTHRRDKIDIHVDFPLHGLDLRPYVLHWNEGEEPVYDCYAVSNHYGGLGGGHYTAYALNDGQWCHYDDSIVTEDVDEKEVVSRAAYVLYYRRRDVNPAEMGTAAVQTQLYSNGTHHEGETVGPASIAVAAAAAGSNNPLHHLHDTTSTTNLHRVEDMDVETEPSGSPVTYTPPIDDSMDEEDLFHGSDDDDDDDDAAVAGASDFVGCGGVPSSGDFDDLM